MTLDAPRGAGSVRSVSVLFSTRTPRSPNSRPAAGRQAVHKSILPPNFALSSIALGDNSKKVRNGGCCGSFGMQRGKPLHRRRVSDDKLLSAGAGAFAGGKTRGQTPVLGKRPARPRADRNDPNEKPRVSHGIVSVSHQNRIK